LFDEVAEALRGLVPRELGEVRTRAQRYGVKAWFGPVKPPRVHYEAQVIGAQHVEDAAVLALEVGFHAENASREANDEALAPLLASEKGWRRSLGTVAVAARVGDVGRPRSGRPRHGNGDRHPTDRLHHRARTIAPRSQLMISDSI